MNASTGKLREVEPFPDSHLHPRLSLTGRRMARPLTLLLLYQAGYEVGRYISLEQIVERTKESYYDTLYQSSQDWHSAQHTLPWEYFRRRPLGLP